MAVTRPALAIALFGAALCSGASCSVSCDAAYAFAAEEDPEVKPGQMVLVDGGTFEMGDIFDEEVLFAAPVHEVTVSSFHLGKYEVTVEEFAAFVKDSGYVTSAESGSVGATCPDDEYGRRLASCGSWLLDPTTGQSWSADANWKNPRIDQSSGHPVTCVSWTDAVSYCNWLSRKEGLPVAYDVETGDMLDAQGQPTADVLKVRGYRLPTEAEWEFAARERGRKIRFGNGQDVARSSEMNFDAASAKFAFAEKGKRSAGTVPVGSFKPNSLGLHDMSGNVWEWCSDFLGRYSEQPHTNPYQQEGMLGPRRAARGGPWFGNAGFSRVESRIGWVADDRCNNIGFRVARSK